MSSNRNPEGKNQYLPNPPLDVLLPFMQEYWDMDWNAKKILERIKDKHMPEGYDIGLTKFRQYMNDAGLVSSRKQHHTVESLKPYAIAVRAMYPKAGMLDFKTHLKVEHKVVVPRSLLTEYFKIYEPHLVKTRKGANLKRKQFWAAGVGDIWTIDQHDKWKYKFGLALHICVDPFSGHLKWLKVWWTNSNPRLIVTYYIEAVRENLTTCLVTQSDMGTENVGVANAHTMLRQRHDPDLKGTIQHRYMTEKKNIKPEIEWSQFRRRCAPGWEDLMDFGVHNGWYDSENYLENLVFRWVFIPLLQQELDNYRYKKNYRAKRQDKHKILPQGVPADINRYPEEYDSLDFAITVDPARLDEIERKFVPDGHECLQLVPPSFETLISRVYLGLGRPEISRSSVWDVYNRLLDMLRSDHSEILAQHASSWQESVMKGRDENWGKDDFSPLEGRPLIEEPGYLGGVNGGLGLQGEIENSLNFEILERPALELDFDFLSDDENGDTDQQSLVW